MRARALNAETARADAARLPARLRLQVRNGCVVDGAAEDAVRRLGGNPEFLATEGGGG